MYILVMYHQFTFVQVDTQICEQTFHGSHDTPESQNTWTKSLSLLHII